MTLERLIRVAQTALEGSEADLGHVTAQTRLQEDLGLNLSLIHILLAFLPFYHIFGLMASLLWFIFFGVTFVFLERYDSRSIQYACKVGRVAVYKRQSHSRCSSFRMAHASCAMPRSSMTLSRRMAVRRSSSAASGLAVEHSSERRIGSPMTTSVRLPKP